MHEHYCGWCGATTVGSYDRQQETWICGICRGADRIPGAQYSVS